MKAIIVCSGTIEDYSEIKKYFDECDYIISVDGGARHLRKIGIVPHILIGDFDSVVADDFNYFKDIGIEALKFPSEKDMTDSELAIETALEKGATEIVLLGALGSRMDHSIANILMLKKLLDIGIDACVIDEKNEIRMCKDSMLLPIRKGRKISLIPVSEKAYGVYISGVKYPLINATMDLGTTWGVSNEYESENVTVSVKEGILLVCVSCD